MHERQWRLRHRHVKHRLKLLPDRVAFQDVRHNAHNLPQLSRLTRGSDAHARADWLRVRQDFSTKAWFTTATLDDVARSSLVKPRGHCKTSSCEISSRRPLRSFRDDDS